MKFSQCAKPHGISYRTTLCWWRAEAINGYQAPTGTISLTEGQPASSRPEKVTVCARVSSLLSAKITWNGKQHGSEPSVPFGALRWLNVGGSQGQRGHFGVHDRRPRVLALLTDTSVARMVVAYWDRLCRFGAHYLETLFVAQPRRGRSKSRTWRRTIRRA